jgi:hypothetical protein
LKSLRESMERRYGRRHSIRKQADKSDTKRKTIKGK